MASTPPNPYIAGPPVEEPAHFFGRKDIIEEVERTLRYPNHNAVILYGQRRIGKTSLLRYLEQRLPDPPFFTVYFNLIGKATLTISEVLYEMAEAAANKAGMPAPPAADFQNNPSAFDQDFLPSLYRALGSERRPIFLLDEFDALDIPESDIPETQAVRSLDAYLFELLNRQSYTDFVFAAGRRMSELTSVLDSTYQADLTRFVSVLNPEQARALILQEGKTSVTVPTYDQEAVERILWLTRGHPYLTQMMGQMLFDRAIRRSSRSPRVTASDVDAAAQELIETDDDGLPLIWASLPPAECITLAAVAKRIKDKDEFITPDDIKSTLAQAGIPAETPGLSQAPANLVNWQMLEQRGGYAFFIPLMGRWLGQNQPLEQVKPPQLARLDPEAENLYRAGQLAYFQGQDEKAVSLLSRALTANADHVPARLLSGRILREQDHFPAAVDQYEEAYRRDPPISRAPLVVALLDHGRAREQAGHPVEALPAYERVLEISPNNAAALARRDALKKKARPQTQPQERRSRWAAFIVVGILLLALCLLCLFFYNPFTGLNPASTTATAIAQAELAATNAAATANAAAAADTLTSGSPTSEAGGDAAIGSPGQSGDDADTSTETQAGQQTPGASGDTSGGEDSSQADSDESAAATATAQAAADVGTSEGETPSGQLSGEINLVGSDSMQPLMQELADAFTAQNPGVQISIRPDTPQSSLEAFQRGEAEVGMVARELSQEELAQLGNAQVQNVAENDPVVVVAHILAPVDNLTTQQVQDIFSGSITNWSELGGPDVPITVVGRDTEADTRLVFEQILGAAGGSTIVEEASNRAVRNSVSTQPYAIGYIPLDQVDLEPITDPAAQNWGVVDTSLLEIKVLALDQIEPSLQNANSGAYPVTRPLNLVSKNPPDDLVQRWLEFIAGPEGQEIIEAAGHTPAATP